MRVSERLLLGSQYHLYCFSLKICRDTTLNHMSRALSATYMPITVSFLYSANQNEVQIALQCRHLIFSHSNEGDNPTLALPYGSCYKGTWYLTEYEFATHVYPSAKSIVFPISLRRELFSLVTSSHSSSIVYILYYL